MRRDRCSIVYGYVDQFCTEYAVNCKLHGIVTAELRFVGISVSQGWRCLGLARLKLELFYFKLKEIRAGPVPRS